MNKNRNSRTAAAAAAVLLSLSAAANAQTQIFSETAAWDYLHPTTGVNPALADGDFGSTWYLMDGTYNGVPFTTNKPGPFSYGTITYWGNTGTFIGTGGTATAPASGLRYTAYFKRQFTTAEDLTDANLVMLVDDGAVIYIDGVERKRVNMTGTVVGRETNGTGDDYPMLADGAASETVILPPISLGAIPAGTHTIAISLHNSATDSSDLGLWVQMYGSAPPVPLLKTRFGGVATDVTAVPGFAGWTGLGPYSFEMNGVAGTLESQPIDLQTIGEAYFAMQIYCYEFSTGSNFEATDELSIKLLFTLDDNTQTELNLVPDSLDLDINGKLNGEDFNPGLLPATASVVLGRQLTGVIPANVKSATLKIIGLNDSGSEFFSFGGAIISDVPLDSDDDKDGVNLAGEMFAGTNPADGSSYLRADVVSLDFDTTLATPAWIYRLTFPTVSGKTYSIESSADAGATWEALGFISATTTGLTRVSVNLGATLKDRYFERAVCVP